MSPIIVADKLSLHIDKELSADLLDSLKANGYGHAIPKFDSRHPDFSDSQRREILKQRYQHQLIEDGLEIRHLVTKPGGGIALMYPPPPLSSVAGYIFEAYSVRAFNTSKDKAGKFAYLWSTEKRRAKQDYLEQFHAVGVGFRSTEQRFPDLYNPCLRQFDVIFYRLNPKRLTPEPATIHGTTNPAGIQIKAITTNEATEIIEPILSGKYRRVLTYLRHRDGRHSFEACQQIAKQMRRDDLISREACDLVEGAIRCPEMLGIDQRDVDDYYNYIRAWYNESAREDEIILQGIGIPIKEQKSGSSLVTTLSG
jgi:hypothetical protein